MSLVQAFRGTAGTSRSDAATKVATGEVQARKLARIRVSMQSTGAEQSI